MTEWMIKNKEFSGEMYDLTASSHISATGKLKYTAATANGISDTFQKYIEELKYMTDDQRDDKFYKRIERLTFLQNCQEFDTIIKETDNIHKEITELKHEYLEKLFSFTCNYLNGSNGIDQHINQPIIIILSGGNVTTIYINLLKNLFLHTNEITEFIDKYFVGIQPESKDELKIILERIIKSFNIKLPEILAISQAITEDLRNTRLKLSDLDFIIVPNKNEIINSYFTKGGGVAEKRDNPEQLNQQEKLNPPLRSSKRTKGPQTETLQQQQEKEENIKREKQLINTTRKNTELKKEKKENAELKKAELKKEKKEKKENAELKKVKDAAETLKRKLSSSIKNNINEPKNYKYSSIESEGVLLVRLKTANKYLDIKNNYKNIPPEIRRVLEDVNRYYGSTEKGCYGNMNELKTTIQLLRQPQLFRLDYLTTPKVVQLCKDFLLKMQAQKKLISMMTDLNLEYLINYLCSIEKDSVKIDDTIKLANFMKFIHINGKRQNKLIEDLCKGKPRISYVLDINNEIQINTSLSKIYTGSQQVLDNFKSLENITNRNMPLVKIMCELVLEFSNNDIIKNVLKKIADSFPKSQVNKGKYSNISPSTYELAPLHGRLTYSTSSLTLVNTSAAHEKAKTIDKDIPEIIIPNNSKISTNIFTPLKIVSGSEDDMTQEDIAELMVGIELIKSSEEMFQDDITSLEENMKALNLSFGAGKGTRKRKKLLPPRKRNTKKQNIKKRNTRKSKNKNRLARNNYSKKNN